MYDKFDANNVKVMRKAIEAALEPLGKKFGMSFKLEGNLKYTSNAFEVMLACAIGDISVKEREDFTRNCRKHGFTPDDYGKEFVDTDGFKVRFVGFKARAKTYPCVCEKTDANGNVQRIAYTEQYIKRMLVK